jgi:enediyne biosynthesis protein E4
MARIGILLIGFGTALVVGCRNEPSAPAVSLSRPETQTASTAGPRFEDASESSGVQFMYRNGDQAGHYSILESLGGGVAVADLDRDGRCDLFCTGGGTFDGQKILGLNSVLYRNLGDLRFADISAHAGDGFLSTRYNHGAFAADFDDDGFIDVLITGYNGLELWRNLGDGTFVEDHQGAGLDDTLWSSAAAWGDVNGDGFLDVYVAHYVDWSFENHPFCAGHTPDQRDICPPRSFSPLPDSLYFSNGDGTFRSVQQETGLRSDGKGLAVMIADVNLDGHADIYVANDTTPNFLYFGDGTGRLEELGSQRGVSVDGSGIPNGSMGLDLIDFNQDGRPDIWVTNYEREDFALYRNEGSSNFLHVSGMTGLNVMRGLFVGFGTLGGDFDRDGDEDLVVSNGHVIRFPLASPRKQLPLYLENRKARFYRHEFQGAGYFNTAHEGRGLATGDLDGDGDQDLVASHLNAPIAVLRNDTPPLGGWLRVRLIGRASNRDALGAVLTLKTSQRQLLRQVKSSASYLSTSETTVDWGFGADEKLQELTVRWPSGHVTVLAPPPANQQTTIVEPADPSTAAE